MKIIKPGDPSKIKPRWWNSKAVTCTECEQVYQPEKASDGTFVAGFFVVHCPLCGEGDYIMPPKKEASWPWSRKPVDKL